MNFLKQLWDTEMRAVLGVGTAGGTVSGFWGNITLANVVAFLTGIYVAIRIVKQLRDWNQPDKG